MSNPTSIALCLRAYLLLGLLWLAAGPVGATPRQLVTVRPGHLGAVHQTQPERTDVLQLEACPPPHLGLFRPDAPALALLLPADFPGFFRVRLPVPGPITQVPASAASPLLRPRLRASVSPNAP
ncbi:hypothetical protein [Hymenobacter cellulosivorans]|uniref:Uncharacterized protein n=1 Tax=Hymenobacter cellulosivorans TaxID=2932249 RepID=A0ABY4FF54_9BACT|nr:hypothetical protein [Hymenobacter cellulosivorans]UOQ55312.1 hypothetical protein MUN80_11285 [Hymenobacter cellulosivorans]